MIKASELRIGNLVLNDKVVNEVIGIMCDDSCTLKTLQGNFIHARYELIQPIPLTAEWLLKFGFEIQEDEGQNIEGNNRVIYRNGIAISLNSGKFHLWIYTDDDSWYSQELGTFQYVHQLQNLYFALTNTELKLK